MSVRYSRFILGLLLIVCSTLLFGCGYLPAANVPSFQLNPSGTQTGIERPRFQFPPRLNRSLKALELTEGKHPVGSEETIRPGRYQITGVGNGNVNIYYRSVLYLSEILNWEAFGVQSLTVDLKEGHMVEISELESARLAPVDTEMGHRVSAGDWVVGLDIEPGRLTASVSGEQAGRIAIYDNHGYVRFSESIGGVWGRKSYELLLEPGERLVVYNLDLLELLTEE